jgi:hypothetical protein
MSGLTQPFRRPVKQLEKPQKICYVSTVSNICQSGPAGWPRLAGNSGFPIAVALLLTGGITKNRISK